MMDIPVNIDPKLYTFLRDLLASGKASHNGIDVDMTGTQKITISGDRLLFDPPVKVKVNKGIFRVSTTVTSVKNAKSGIHINVDNSPVDIEVRPSA